MQKQSYLMVAVFVTLTAFCTGVNAQVEALAGSWNVEVTGIEGAEFSAIQIENNGKVTFTESYPYIIGNDEYIFDVEHTGLMTVNEDNQFIYAGLATGTARGTDGTIMVRLEVGASGIVSEDNNMLIGVWGNLETYTTPTGEIKDEDSYTLTLIRDGYDPGTPGEAIAGTWEISIQGQNVGWTGQVTLNPDGTMTGEYYAEAGLPPIPLAGFFSYSEDHHFEFTYSTTTELPTVGETTFTLSGEGQGNEDNTEINGTWEFTVDVSDRLSMTFSGTFSLKKIENTEIYDWTLFD